jgi:hypothetical protein
MLVVTKRISSFCLKLAAVMYTVGTADGGTVVNVLRYKSEGRWFESRWCNGIFHWRNPSDRTMALGSTQPLTEMSTRSISWNPLGHSRPVTGLLWLYLYEHGCCLLMLQKSNLGCLAAHWRKWSQSAAKTTQTYHCESCDYKPSEE